MFPRPRIRSKTVTAPCSMTASKREQSSKSLRRLYCLVSLTLMTSWNRSRATRSSCLCTRLRMYKTCLPHTPTCDCKHEEQKLKASFLAGLSSNQFSPFQWTFLKLNSAYDSYVKHQKYQNSIFNVFPLHPGLASTRTGMFQARPARWTAKLPQSIFELIQYIRFSYSEMCLASDKH